jgi:hypothetical protein
MECRAPLVLSACSQGSPCWGTIKSTLRKAGRRSGLHRRVVEGKFCCGFSEGLDGNQVIMRSAASSTVSMVNLLNLPSTSILQAGRHLLAQMHAKVVFVS